MANDTTTVVSTFDDRKAAEQAIEALRKEGFAEKNIEILTGDAEKIRKQLSEEGFEDEDVGEFADAAEAGKTLIAARVAQDKADQAAGILERLESSQGEQGEGEESKAIPVVEEEVSVGKKQAGKRGVRVSSKVKEKPVEETVTLNEERVEAERRDADRELSPEEADAAFQDKTVEVTGRREEAEVEKKARVVGEVEVTKETAERQETVRDTARKSDVEVEKVGSGSERK